jgi:lipopolysaccharide transport system ATP-binding protein
VSEPVISVEKLGKRYRIGARRDGTGKGAGLLRLAAAPFDYIRTRLRPPEESEILWALRDVSFEVKRGEVLGIIGRNGAGKSTLLKILSRITDPTKGWAEVRGRVNSLLEVGTGFHPELTGRENIFLNAAIHGLRRAEIARKFDEIVEFSEVGRFIDTPVKRYSSGMYTRLAFGVAAHLDPDILLVDEVLAVGDLSFQRKCLGQMSKVAEQGRTVLFVSHNMGAMSTLCRRLLFLDNGTVRADGPTEDVMALYVAEGETAGGSIEWPDIKTAPGDDVLRLTAVRVLSGGRVTGDVPIDQPVQIELEYENLKANAQIMSAVYITTHLGVGVLSALNAPSACIGEDPWFERRRPRGRFLSRCTLPPSFFNDGTYRVTPVLLTESLHTNAIVNDAVSFRVHETGAMRREFHGTWMGVVRPRTMWVTEYRGGGSGGEGEAGSR